VSLNRALPGPVIDLVRDGVHQAELREEGQGAVWRALVRTASSACQRGWDRWEWEELLQQPASALGRQAATRDGRRPLTREAMAKKLADAWDRATVWASEQPAKWTRAEAEEQALRRADLVAELAADPAAQLAPSERAVLAHAAALARKWKSDRPAVRRREAMAATGLKLTALRTTLARLEERQLLVLAEHGRPGAGRSGRANLYRLPREDHAALAPYLYPETGSVVPAAQVCGAPARPEVGAPPQVCGAPLPPAPRQEPHVVTVTITASDPDTVTITTTSDPDTLADTLAAAMRALQAVPRVEVAGPADQQDQVGNVVHLAAHRREATS